MTSWTWLAIRRRDALVLFGVFAALGVVLGNAAHLAMRADRAEAHGCTRSSGR
jgi:hypothetical protein